MMKLSTLIIVSGLAAAVQIASAGDIIGTVNLKGTPPKEKDITPVMDDVNCSKLHTTVPTTRFYVVGSKGELADVIVSLEGISGKSTGASAPPAILDQKGCLYVPSIFAVQTGQKLLVKNSDPVLHNIHTAPAEGSGNKEATSDSEIIVQLIAHSKSSTLVDAIADSLSQVDGAFSIVMMTRDRIFAARDPRGFRPLSMGRIRNADGPDTIVFASETCAFDLLRAEYERDVLPGERVMVTDDGVTSRQFASGVPQSSCVFEHVYFARPDSRIFGRWVQESRDQMGRQLARESGAAADVVVPVPDSGVTAALGYAEEAKLPFRLGLIRNHYVGRTFIEPEQRVRDFGVRLKLNPVRNLLEGKRVILIDDSIIRGTTSRKIVRMVRGAGAKEVHLRISCPPTISPCFYGVDTPSKRDLIAANKSIEEIRQFIGADSLAYLSLEGLLKSCEGIEHNGDRKNVV